MIPVEKIAGGTLGNLLYYVSIIGVLLVICTIIRLKVSFLRKAFIPASLLAGIIGMILGPHVLGVIPADMMSSIGAIPSHMITMRPPVLAGSGRTPLCRLVWRAFCARSSSRRSLA